MLHFSRLKIFTILAICFLAIIYSIPSLFFMGDEEGKSFLPNKKVNLGLDLKGGSQLMLEVNFDYYLAEQLTNIQNELKASFREESIRSLPRTNNKEITFRIEAEEDKDRVKKLVKDISSKINVAVNDNVFALYFSKAEIEKMRQKLLAQSIEIIRRRIDENGTKEPTIQAQGNSRILLQVPGVKDSSELKEILGKTAKMTFQFVKESSSFGGDASSYDVYHDDAGYRYLIEKEVILSGDLLIDANPTFHEGQPAVAFRFNDLGSKKFAKITRENIGRIFAIILDEKVVTAPRINTSIVQGAGVISGNFTTKEANDVALLLRAGALPAPLKVIEERTVGPSLGLDSIKSGSMAAISSMIFVAMFMVVFYRIFGVFANLALVINIAIILSFLSLIGATLTLPGIAGIVLTMGMAVDANVLIFERIKEELRQKRTIFMSVEQGFTQAFRTIVDSNITALIVAFFLFAFGNGPVKGFAVTLSIGIIASMFTAIMLTRMMISLWLKKTRPQKLNLV
ncbi:MAG: protein translocase subunit SecD [Rickettsiales bacterium]|nr:protein translocase subunit SecD [Rickettsiales bacterium]